MFIRYREIVFVRVGILCSNIQNFLSAVFFLLSQQSTIVLWLFGGFFSIVNNV